jgi:hypothetical protein
MTYPPCHQKGGQYQLGVGGQGRMRNFCDLARLEPPAPELQRLLGEVQASQDAMDGFVSVIAGTLPSLSSSGRRTPSAS